MHQAQTYYIQIFQLPYKNDIMNTPPSKCFQNAELPSGDRQTAVRLGSLPISRRPQTFIWIMEDRKLSSEMKSKILGFITNKLLI